MRFSNIVMAYFVIAVVMWGGGALGWGEAGLANLFIENPAEGDLNEETAGSLEQIGGPIEQAAATIGGGGLLAVMGFILNLVGFLFWPITVLLNANAPPQIVALLGGVPVVAFYGGLLRMVRSSA